MRKRTPEQIAAGKARRAALADLARTVAAMTPEARADLAARSVVTTIEGRPLSPFNCCFIATQNPAASLVGGFAQWLKVGRCVRRGEHGMGLWVPCAPKASQAPEEATSAKVRFIIGTVFDVSQTDELEEVAA